MATRTTSEILDSARPLVAAWRSYPEGVIRATDPHSVVRFLRLREESGMTSEAWCRHLRVPIATGYFWSVGKTAGGKDWPALAAALAKAAGADIAAGMNAALAPSPAAPVPTSLAVFGKAARSAMETPTPVKVREAFLLPASDKAAALAMLANAIVPAKPAPAAPSVLITPEDLANSEEVAEPIFGSLLDAWHEQTPRFAHAEAREVIASKRGRGSKTTPWSLGEAATLVRLHKAAGGTMDAFSKAVGLQNSALAVWSSGRTTTGKPWPELCEALGIPVPAQRPSPSPVLDKGTPILFDAADAKLPLRLTADETAPQYTHPATAEHLVAVPRSLIGNAPAERLAVLGIRATSMGDDDTITLALTAGGPAQRALVRFALGITPSLRIEV
jgi:hypothetical protein